MRLYSPIQDRGQLAEPGATGVIDAVVESNGEPCSIDEIINAALRECGKLPHSYQHVTRQIEELHSRLAYGRLHLAVVGEFNRGKSTFINGLIGLPLLPTSVLPITTVPTRIVYGPEISCTIRFFNGKPDIIVRSLREKISTTLLQYVAEENNPKNQYCVETVEVTVPSPLLKNSTVLIDTPGFGSTYLHNTKSALDSLTDCDAALFLLSADPPMTQTEVEFLKAVSRHVPRLFFILNKVDLLTAQQAQQVDDFICDIIRMHVRQTEKVHLFHVCARRAEWAKEQSIEDQQWTRSGMESIKNDIIDFMAREKFFTLSQALTDKLKQALSGIITMLQKNRDDFESPLIQLNRERDVLMAEKESIRKAMKKELSLVEAEKTAFYKHLKKLLDTHKQKLLRQAREALAILLDTSPCSGSALKGITATFRSVTAETLNGLSLRLVADLNRPLKKAVRMHERELTAITQAVYNRISGFGTPPESSFDEKLDSIELAPDSLPGSSGALTGFAVSLQWKDKIYSRKAIVKRLHDRYDELLDELLEAHLFSIAKELKRQIGSQLDILGNILSDELTLQTRQLDRLMKHKEEAISDQLRKNNRAATNVTARIEAFNRILGRLV